MSIYTGFAPIYDELMTNIPYEKWGIYITNELKERQILPPDSLILDLACGTGNMTLLLAEMGFDMIGVDISADMLAQAQKKAYEAGCGVLFLSQDMRKLDLYGTVDAVVCVCDGMNYILDATELAAVFARLHLFLNPGGVFIFDMNTEYKYKELFGSRIFEANVDGGATYEWENFYDADSKINEYHVVFNDEFTEVHRQRAYGVSEIVELLKNAGFRHVSVYHDYTNEPVRVDTGRVTFVADAAGLLA